MDEWFVSWGFGALVVICLFGIFFIAQRKSGVWFNPASLFSLAWAVYISVPLVVGVGVQFNPVGVLYILIFVICFSMSVFLFEWSGVLIKNRAKIFGGYDFSSRFILCIFVFCFFVALWGHFLDLKAQNIDAGFDLLAIGGEYAQRRYSEELDQNFYSKIALLASFQCAVLGGLIFGSMGITRRRGLVLITAFVPSMLVMLLQSAKGLLFLSAAYFIGGWLVSRVFSNDFRRPQIPVVLALVLFLILFILVVVSFVARFGGDIDILRYYLASYSAGHLFAFSDWLSDRYFLFSVFRGYEQLDMQGGFYTFMGIFRALGDSRYVPLGVYAEFFEIDGVMATNIYTAFRGLITDFGLIGSFVFALVSGCVAHLTFYILLRNEFSILSVACYVYFVGFAYQSYGVSSFTWISILASVTITLVIIFVFKRFSKRGVRTRGVQT